MRPPLTLLLVLANSLLCTVLGLGVEDALYYHDFQQLLQSGELDLQSEDTADGSGGTNPNPNLSINSHPVWSHEPVCTQKLPAPIDSELCVYTSENFAGGRGISFFTTPAIAEEIVGLVPFRDPTFLSLHDINLFRGNWYTQKIPGKGVGMLAKRDIDRGDVIAAYTPVLVAYTEKMLGKQEREKFLRLAINRLPGPTREAYFNLATVHGDDPDILAQDIASANSFGVQLGGGGSLEGGKAHLAVFPENSRLNHACAPNAQWRLNSSQLVQWVVGARPIAKRDEITIAYANPLEPFASRQNHLSKSFRFDCACARCLEGDQDDEILTEIAALQARLSDWSSSSSGSGASVKQAERLVQLYKQDGLDAYLDVPYALAALTYSGAGSLRGATKYIELVLEAIEIRLGPDAPELQEWRDMLANPTAHASWMKRKGR